MLFTNLAYGTLSRNFENSRIPQVIFTRENVPVGLTPDNVCAVQPWLSGTVEGYHQYSGGITSVRRRDTMSTAVDVQYNGGMISVRSTEQPPLYCAYVMRGVSI